MSVFGVTQNGMCVGCGACAGVCSFDAINMRYKKDGSLFAHIDNNKCIECGRCLKVCPSRPEREIGETEAEIFHGKLKNKAYLTYAVDDEIRAKGQSGGTVTALLLYLLENEKIHGVATCKYNAETAAFETNIAQNKQGLLDSVGSNYIQFPHCKSIIENSKKIDAAVLLGCQSEALGRVRNLNLKYRFGLICAGLYKKTLMNEFVDEVSDNSISNIRFKDKRYGGFPGDTVVESGNEKYTFAKSERLRYFKSYGCLRCFACNLKLNNDCDILFGDPWGFVLDDIDKGYNVAIPITEKGEELLKIAEKENIIHARPVDLQKVINGQFMNYYKSKFYTVLKEMKRKNIVPPYKVPDEKIFKGISEDKNVRNDFNYLWNIYNCDDEKAIKDVVETHKKNQLLNIRKNSIMASIKRNIKKIMNMFRRN